MRKLEVKSGQAQKEEDICNIGVAERGQHALTDPHFLFPDQRSLCLQYLPALFQGHFAAVDLLQQPIQIRRHEVDHLKPQRFLGRYGHALPDRLFNPLLVSAPLLRDTDDISHGIVLHFLLHCLVHAAADPDADGMGRPDVRARSHGRNMGGNRHDDARGSRPGARRGNINNDRQGRVQDALGDVPHGQVEAARRVEENDQTFRALLRRLLDALEDIRGDRRRDRRGNRDGVVDGLPVFAGGGVRKKEREDHPEKNEDHHGESLPEHAGPHNIFMIICTSSQTCFFAPGFRSR